jgi:hypothetical protein
MGHGGFGRGFAINHGSFAGRGFAMDHRGFGRGRFEGCRFDYARSRAVPFHVVSRNSEAPESLSTLDGAVLAFL